MAKGLIVTWFNSGRNYGQTLQAYALQEKVSDLGHNVQLINFGSNISRPCGWGKVIKKYLKLKNIDKALIQKKFDGFVFDNLYVTPYFGSNEEIYKYIDDNCIDFVIVGSDQVWNPYNIESIYYLSGLTSDYTRKIAYAVSLCDLKRKNKFYDYPEVKEWVSKFDSIYTRENTGRDIIKEFFDRESDVVLDPTLLYSGEEWINKLKLRKKKVKKYFLFYLFNITSEMKKYIEQIEKEGIYEIHYGNVLMNQSKKTKNWSPIDFLEEIYNAEEIITDSFHGTAFSILFHKNFWVIDNGKDENSDPYYNFDRMQTLLQHINLQDRILDSNKEYKKSIDYSCVDSMLATIRKESIEKLNQSIIGERVIKHARRI